MPSFVVHGVVPALAMMATGRLRRARVLALLPLTYLPDLDYVVGVHRATGHNVFILVPFLAWAWWEMDRGGGWERAEWPTIVGGYLASHLVMDAFVGGISPLWPLDPRAVFLWVAVRVDTATNTPTLVFEPGTLPGAPTTAEEFLWISPTDVAILALLVGLVIVTWAARHVRASVDEDEGVG